MYCPNCGAKIPDDSKFCPYCGYRIKLEGKLEPSPEAIREPGVRGRRGIVVEVCSGPHEGESKEMPVGNSLTLGREPSNVDWALFMDRYISRRHAALRVLDTKTVEVIDLKSTNGSFIVTPGENGVSLEKLDPSSPRRITLPCFLKVGNSLLFLSG